MHSVLTVVQFSAFIYHLFLFILISLRYVRQPSRVFVPSCAAASVCSLITHPAIIRQQLPQPSTALKKWNRQEVCFFLSMIFLAVRKHSAEVLKNHLHQCVSSGNKEDTTTLHLLGLLKELITTFPQSSVKSCCETLLRLMTLSHVVRRHEDCLHIYKTISHSISIN